MWMEHIVVGALLIGMPLYSGLEALSVRKSRSSEMKMRSYVRTIIILWTFTIAAAVLYGPMNLMKFPLGADELPKLGELEVIVLIVALLVFLGTSIVPLFMLRMQMFKDNVEDVYHEKAYIFPISSREKWMFVMMVLSVGICEEILYRSFLVRYLDGLALGIPIVLSLAIGALFFGLNHWAQGWFGIVNTALFGALLAFVFGYTGSLWLPIVIHVLYDLKLFLMIPDSLKKRKNAH